MKFLIDNSLPPRLAELLNTAGHDAIHVRSVMPATSPDAAVLAAAVASSRVLIAADVDFVKMLAQSLADQPSVIHIRGNRREASHVAAMIIRNLVQVHEPLVSGAVVEFGDELIGVRPLPIR